MQSFSLCVTPLDHSCGNQLYERKHNPFISYLDVQSNPARVANIVDFSEFATDLASGNVPDYVWISPEQCNDMHGRASTPDDPFDFSGAGADCGRRLVSTEHCGRDHEFQRLDRQFGYFHRLGRE
jgi:hypothetical protein